MAKIVQLIGKRVKIINFPQHPALCGTTARVETSYNTIIGNEELIESGTDTYALVSLEHGNIAWFRRMDLEVL